MKMFEPIPTPSKQNNLHYCRAHPNPLIAQESTKLSIKEVSIVETFDAKII